MKAIPGLMDGTCKLMAELMYGAGLRVHECVTLHVKDIDLLARTITVRSGKGGKDRTTVLPELRVASQRREPSHSRATNRCFLLPGRRDSCHTGRPGYGAAQLMRRDCKR